MDCMHYTSLLNSPLNTPTSALSLCDLELYLKPVRCSADVMIRVVVDSECSYFVLSCGRSHEGR